MKIYHKIETVDNKNIILLYVEYPDEYEFSLDFDSLKKNVANVADKIRNYAYKYLGGISDNTALLILNGVVVGTLMLTQLTTNQSPKANDTQIVASVDEIENNEKIDTDTINQQEKKEETTNEEINELKKEEPIEEKSQENNANTTAQTQKVTQTKTTSSTKQTTTTTKSSSSTQNKTSNSNTNTQKTNEKTINVKLASGKIENMPLEDYVIGVVAAEMPAEFHNEALKAQAVASRTYALKKTASGQAISATTSDQIYNTIAELKKKWGSSYDKYYNKIKNAVNATKGECLTYKGAYIEALFFSTSNGKTEDSVYVWGNSFDYLKSVDSPWDTSVSGFKQTKTISMSEISKKLGVNLTSISQISINSKTSGNRVNNVTFCGKSFTGVQIRQLLGLRSADFEVAQSGNNIIFTTKGYGHGVGMSQYGANGMAKAGNSYTQILKHYYTGVSIVKK